ncbi:hypothetical protein LWI28_023631 [Acer negundo]|uniref:chorismate synthase n=1 Tax=Acer negundo TaxID=4023 RepID=A0AAD5IBH2_ACENE|nr:hypothetical protein LWI28_023631 [Acer negundo]
MQFDLDRRRPGQSRITTPRKETDTCKIYSGVSEGMTTGTPIHVFVPNTDQRGHDYSEMSAAYRPSHADATYDMKYGVRSVQGGAICLELRFLLILTLDQIESNIVRCPDPEYAEKMIAAIDAVRECPRGLGSPVFDKLEAQLAKAAMSLPATKGFEFGSGFAGTFMTGSEHNDEFYTDEYGNIRTRTNRSGGVQGGISNGEIINMRIGFKPTSTIARKQQTVTRDKKETELIARGRHDPCVVPRAVPMVEAMVALVLVDQLMAQYAQCHLFPINPELQDAMKFPKLEPVNNLHL